MKKSRLTKVIAVILALTISLSAFGAVTAGATSIYPITNSDNALSVIFADIVDTLLRMILDLFQGLFGNGPGFVDPDADETKQLIAANYYEGIGNEFATAAEDTNQWHLGYANASLIPDDYDNGTYYIGGYIAPENGFTNVVEGIAEIPGLGKDDMKVRTIAINDGSGKGTVLFATIDCIGITNADIKDIRALLADFAAANNIVAINVASTHTHSCIDTEGLWTRNLAKLASNGLNSGFGTGEELQQGTNPEYMAFLKEKVADTLIAAFYDLKPGTLTYAIKDIGEDYFQNKNRPTSGQIIEFDENGNIIADGKRKIAMTEIHRFVFTPDDEAARPTMMLNIAAHPDVAGLPTESNSGREISGDYVFYCGQLLDKAGYNFMFFQGSIAGIYMSRGATGDNVETFQRVEESQRYGQELARILLSMNLTEEEIKADPIINSNADEIEENTKLIDIYDENGNLVPEFTENNFSFVDYVKSTVKFDIGDGETFDINIHNIEAFGVEVDMENNAVKVISGDRVAMKFVYSDEYTIVNDTKTGLCKVLNGEDILVEAFITKAGVAFGESTDGESFIITDAEGVELYKLEAAPASIDKDYTTFVRAENGALYEDNKMPVNPYYTLWYENWEPVEEVEVEPYLNLYLKQVEIHIENSLIMAVGKLNMANYVVLTNDDGTYSTITEIGYMEIGQVYKTVFLPGEICQDLVAPNGASLLASNSVTAQPFMAPTACSLFGNDVACMGLMNDAIGYVVPDNDYTMGDPANHYHELISLGKTVASELMFGLEELSREIVYY
ncbi:MAG: hypothetical protein J6Q83_06590 [Clostridia bacterium]|nr:hypothetical protein [Clostridia bacterium]